MECKGYPKANKNCSMLCTNFGFAASFCCFSFVWCRSGFLGGTGIGCEEDPAPLDDPKVAPCDDDVDVREKPRGST